MADPFSRDPRFDALRNALYHTERRNFLDLLNRALNFLVIILGAGVAGKAAHLFHVDENWLELSVVFFATLQLVFDLGGRARVHEFLQRRYYELLSEMETETLDNETSRRKWSAKLLTISSDEPMPLRALDAIAYNKALTSTYSEPDVIAANRQRVTWWQRRFRHLCAFQMTAFPVETEYLRQRNSRLPWRWFHHSET